MNPHQFGTEAWIEHEMCKEPDQRDARLQDVFMGLADSAPSPPHEAVDALLGAICSSTPDPATGKRDFRTSP